MATATPPTTRRTGCSRPAAKQIRPPSTATAVTDRRRTNPATLPGFDTAVTVVTPRAAAVAPRWMGASVLPEPGISVAGPAPNESRIRCRRGTRSRAQRRTNGSTPLAAGTTDGPSELLFESPRSLRSVRVAIAGGHGQIALRLAKILSARGDEIVALIRNPDHRVDVRTAGA